MKAMLVTVYGEYPETGFEEVETDGGIDDMYRFLGVECIDLAVRSVGGKPYTFVVDDIGLFADNPRPCAFRKGMPDLVGNTMVFGFDGSPDMIGLTDADVKNLLKHLKVATAGNNDVFPDFWPAFDLD